MKFPTLFSLRVTATPHAKFQLTKSLSFSTVISSRHESHRTDAPKAIKTTPEWTVLDKDSFRIDHMSNTPQTILSKLNSNLPSKPAHPLGILKNLIYEQMPTFDTVEFPSPFVTPAQNFDDLGFPADHPGRRKGDSYYLNSAYMLRTHTSAHEIETFAQGKEKWLLTADVYRRDEIDASHFPVFHQMEGACVLPRSQMDKLATETHEIHRMLATKNIKIDDETKIDSKNPFQDCHDPKQATIVINHLKATINKLIYGLFQGLDAQQQASLQVRWIPAFFPFTSPSYEVEVLYRGKWLEILGCGLVKQLTLDKAGVPSKMGWAFGLGLERIAMVLFSIPDIRLFWSQDSRFLNQFTPRKVSKFHLFSKNPPCHKDISFWIPDDFEANDVFELIRDVGGSWVEEVKLIDTFEHQVEKRTSHCYRITYRSMERNLSNDEVNVTQARVREALKSQMGLNFR
ncbi:hypothetical protein CROQUDRAFT_332101 [Cronartium quercuum f. sp. fusiforme G11]|uniref:Phenylalanine--tRNA ligase, mitochondrial n=1 Tax=Cronartium quercuum f. sp. fusiforme G11 TaxID=708437 RepID=A0A9P6TED7_9BASI|nr:hypothetical protein CROQUDRAFT_332101 [Cronartium quercuum f. sp. fusiforme G11]